MAPPSAHISPIKPAYTAERTVPRTKETPADVSADYYALESEYKTLSEKLKTMESTNAKTIADLTKKRDHFRHLTETTESKIRELAKFEPKLERYKNQEAII